MGKHCYNMGFYARAIEWFQEAYTLAGREGNRTLTQDQALQFLDLAIQAVRRGETVVYVVGDERLRM